MKNTLELGSARLIHLYKLGSAFILFLFICITLIHSTPLLAATIAEDFSSSLGLQNGLIVSIDPEAPDVLQWTSLGNAEYTLGVVSEKTDSSVSYSKDGSNVSVALAGEVDVYVSDINGPILAGDFIGPSWLEGVGMKSVTDRDQKLLGIALEDFDSSQAVNYGDIDTSEGQKSASVGSIRVRLFEKEGIYTASVNHSGFQGLLESLTGNSISTIQLFIGTLIFLVGVSLAGFFSLSSIKGSFVSLGRNPLASSSIYRSLLHVTFVSVSIIILGAAVSYAVLVA